MIQPIMGSTPRSYGMLARRLAIQLLKTLVESCLLLKRIFMYVPSIHAVLYQGFIFLVAISAFPCGSDFRSFMIVAQFRINFI